MNEQIPHEGKSAESFDSLKDAAVDVGLLTELPSKGTPACWDCVKNIPTPFKEIFLSGPQVFFRRENTANIIMNFAR